MSVKYQDYYEMLGVPRDANAEQIRKSYRKLARQYHPDVNKKPGAEAKFKQITEAYDVLSDPEKRKRYDQLGADWKAGQNFRPPQGWEDIRSSFGARGATGGAVFEGGEGDFSDFFEMLFGGRGFDMHRSTGWEETGHGHDQEVEVPVTLEEAYRGGTKTIALEEHVPAGGGRVRRASRTYDVHLPAGATQGTRIRLSGQGSAGHGGGKSGDLYLRINIQPHPRFRLNGHDLEEDLFITPWEAALGALVSVPTMDGQASVRLPPGTQSGQRIRLKGKGMPQHKGAGSGDLYVTMKIAVPRDLTPAERKLFEQLAEVSSFKPRA